MLLQGGMAPRLSHSPILTITLNTHQMKPRSERLLLTLKSSLVKYSGLVNLPKNFRLKSLDNSMSTSKISKTWMDLVKRYSTIALAIPWILPYGTQLHGPPRETSTQIKIGLNTESNSISPNPSTREMLNHPQEKCLRRRSHTSPLMLEWQVSVALSSIRSYSRRTAKDFGSTETIWWSEKQWWRFIIIT